MRSFFLYQQSHSFAVLTSSIPDATQQLVRKYRTRALFMKNSVYNHKKW